MRKTTFKALLATPLFGSQKGKGEYREVEAYQTKVPGLVVVRSQPLINYNGDVQFLDKGPVVYHVSSGKPISSSYSYCTPTEMVKRVNTDIAAASLDWEKPLDKLSEEELMPYNRIANRVFYGK